MKKIKLSFLLLVLIGMSGTKASAYDFSAENDDGVTIYYNTSGSNDAYVTYRNGDYNSYSGVVRIPSTVSYAGGTRTVTSIGSYAFRGCSSLTSIEIPNSVTSIGGNAFQNCSGLAEMTFKGTNPPSIANNAFDGCNCTFLVPSASYDAYMNANGWSEKYEHNVLTIGTQTNYDVNVTAQNDRSGIYVVIGASKLKNVTTLKLTGTINGYDVMILRDKMPNLHRLDLTDVNIIAGNYEYYSGCTQTYDNVLPAYMFYQQSNLKSIKLPTSITSIDKYAFCQSSISEISIPKEVTSIGENAFRDCGNLKSLNLSNSDIQSIGYQAFQFCQSLTSVDLSNSSIQSIANNAFYNCYNLVTVNLTGCNNLTFIGSAAFQVGSFNSNSSFLSIMIPQSVQTIGNGAFTGYSSLKHVYVQTILPRAIGSNVFSLPEKATLHVPALSYDNYYWATGWSQFANIVEDVNPDYFFVDDDLSIGNGKATDTPVDADIAGTSGIVVQDDNQTFDEVTVSSDNTGSGTLVTENNTTINIINLNITVTANKWQFLSFPYRVKLTDVVAPGFYVFRRYDGAQRASTGGTGWASLAQETEYLEPGVGYIFQSSQSGTLGIRSENPDLKWGTGKTNPLSVYATDNIEHASWNFVGNPMLCYYDIDDLHTTAPLTFWNGSSYVARRPGDDNYQMKPFEAFFLQKPDGLEQLTYDKSGRMTYKQAQEHHNNKNNNARAAERSERFLINLSLTQGQWEDEARVVYNNKKTTAYEPDCDAAKFMSTMSVPQLYAIEGSVQMAIDERPWGEVQLGFIATAEGEHTITATRLGANVLLRDNLLNITHDLSLGGYTFTTEAGTFNDRFTLVPEAETTGINALNEKGEMRNEKFFDLQGRRTTDAAQKGVRIVRKNHETRKIVK